jgi:CubicO group peptidase (beta-lactamase class C family)
MRMSFAREFTLWSASVLAVALPVHGYAATIDSPPAAQKVLDAIVVGSAGVPVAGIVLAHIDRKGHETVLVSGCARFAADGRQCSRQLAPNTLMRVASSSKLVVAVGLMRLVQLGQVELDRDIGDYLGYVVRNPRAPDRSITPRMLLAHLSSLQDGQRYTIAAPGGLRDLLADSDRFDVVRRPGRYFRYANVNYSVLAAVMERASGERFDRYAATRILEPARLTAAFNWIGLQSLPAERVATLYRRQVPDEAWDINGPWIAQVDGFVGAPPALQISADYQLGSNPALFSPQGGLRIAPLELARWVRTVFLAPVTRDAKRAAIAFSNDAARPISAISRNTARSMCRPQFVSNGHNGDTESGLFEQFGLGVHPKKLGAHRWCGHFAEAYGLKGAVLFDQRRGDVLAYYITGYGAPPPGGDGRYPGLDAVETAVLDAAYGLWR